MSVKAEVDALVEQARNVESAIRAEVAEVGAEVEAVIADLKKNIEELKASLDARIEGWRDEPAVGSE